MIDYTASVHFQLYKHIDDAQERCQPLMAVASDVYSAISKTTDLILTFNDRYGDGADIAAYIDHIEHDLSSLGEALADRISHEDMIIDAMLCERRSV
jgi:regulator of sigma D